MLLFKPHNLWLIFGPIKYIYIGVIFIWKGRTGKMTKLWDIYDKQKMLSFRHWFTFTQTKKIYWFNRWNIVINDRIGRNCTRNQYLVPPLDASDKRSMHWKRPKQKKQTFLIRFKFSHISWMGTEFTSHCSFTLLACTKCRPRYQQCANRMPSKRADEA